MLDRALEARESSLDRVPQPLIDQYLAEHRYRRLEELLADIALGNRMPAQVAQVLAPGEDSLLPAKSGAVGGEEILITGSERGVLSFARCCYPIPGDDITGYLGRGEGLVVHTSDCAVAKRLFERDSERWIGVEWSEQPQRAFETTVIVLVRNGKGALADVAQAVSLAEADITHIDMGSERATENTEITLLLAVRDRQHLADVLRTLRRARPVLRVARIKPT
jgi:GTP pyrophosphokinase/guanosine-3',5'-bis(diphosphate) 3'-pyrophosphohydrolase